MNIRIVDKCSLSVNIRLKLSSDLCLHKIVIVVDSVETIARISTQFTIKVIWTEVNRLENIVGKNKSNTPCLFISYS
jgi:hypothetical protein